MAEALFTDGTEQAPKPPDKYAADIHTTTYNPWDDVEDGEIIDRENKTESEHIDIEPDEDTTAIEAMASILKDKGAYYDSSGQWFENDVDSAVVSYATGTHESITVHFTNNGQPLSTEDYEAVFAAANA